MSEQQVLSTYFDEPGPANTERTLELARTRADQLGIQHVVVASTSGATGALAAQVFRGLSVVVVSHSAGFRGPNIEELQLDHRQAILAAGATIHTATHAFGGVGRGVRRKLGTYETEEVIAFTLRNFCEGVKVCCEITLMASDAGLIPTTREVMAIGGTSRGADTAMVLRAANAQDFFDLRVLEVVCKPRCARIPGG